MVLRLIRQALGVVRQRWDRLLMPDTDSRVIALHRYAEAMLGGPPTVLIVFADDRWAWVRGTTASGEHVAIRVVGPSASARLAASLQALEHHR